MNILPPLPEFGISVTGCVNKNAPMKSIRGYTADQMREYAETARAIQAGKGDVPVAVKCAPSSTNGGSGYDKTGLWEIQLSPGAKRVVDQRYAEGWNAALEAALAGSQGEGVGFDMLAHLQRQREWSERTFGPGPRTQGVVDHIRKELLEVIADPSDFSEWIDVIILALDGAWRAGASPQEIISGIVAKQTKNEGRTWPDWRTADPNKAIEHDRSGERVKCDAWSCNGGTVCGPYDNDMICGKCNGTGFKATTPAPAAPDGDGVSALIVRDVCETDPADPQHPDSVCISVTDLARIIDIRLAALSQPRQSEAVADKPALWVWNQGGELYSKTPPDEFNAWKWTPLYTRPQAAAPEGWVLVPVEPTPEIINRGLLLGNTPNQITIIFQSMIAAAPPQAAEGV